MEYNISNIITEKELFLDRLRALDLRSAGDSVLLADQLIAAVGRPLRVAAPNHDFAGVQVKAAGNLERLFQGVLLLKELLNTADVALYLPEQEASFSEEIKEAAEQHGIALSQEFLDVRKEKNALILDYVKTLDLMDVAEDSYEEGVYLMVVKGSEISEVMKLPVSTKIAELTDSLEGVKAVQLGTRLYAKENLPQTLPKSMGAGVIRFIEEKQCLVCESMEHLFTYRREGCGKCTFCREGLIQLHGMMTDIHNGKGKSEQLDLMKEIGEAMMDGTLCSLGHTAPELLLDVIERFPEEMDAHIRKRNCPAGVCTSFVSIYIDPVECQGCGDCVDECPVDCIEGKDGFIHMIEELDCTKCGKCIAVCSYDAIIQTAGRVPKLPERLTKCGKFKKH